MWLNITGCFFLSVIMYLYFSHGKIHSVRLNTPVLDSPCWPIYAIKKSPPRIKYFYKIISSTFWGQLHMWQHFGQIFRGQNLYPKIWSSYGFTEMYLHFSHGRILLPRLNFPVWGRPYRLIYAVNNLVDLYNISINILINFWGQFQL